MGGGGVIEKVFKGNRDKHFFCASSEQIRDARPQGVRQLNVPTDAERNGGFSSPHSIAPNDPLNGKTPFPGGMIGASRIHPLMHKYLNPLPHANVFNPSRTLRTYNFQTQESLVPPNSLHTTTLD